MNRNKAFSRMASILSDNLIINSDNDYYRGVSLSTSTFIDPLSGKPELVEKLGSTPPYKIVLHMHDEQRAIYHNPSRILGMIAGSQGGKTTFVPWWLRQEIITRGGGDHLAVSTNYDLFKLKMLPTLLEVFETWLDEGRYWSADRVIELRDPETGKFWANRSGDKMWGRIILRSADAKGGLESSTCKSAALDECGMEEFPRESFEATIARLALNQGRMLLTSSLYGLGWLKKDVIDRSDFDPNIFVVLFESTKNPQFKDDEFKRIAGSMEPWRFNLRYRSKFDRPPGQIYHDYIDKYREEGGHLVPAFNPPHSWPCFVGIDPGANNTGIIWLALDAEADEYFLFRESLEGDKASAEYAKGVRSTALAAGNRVISWHLGQKSEKQQRLDWKQGGGINALEPPIHDVESGIDRVITLFREHRLFICDDCTGIRDELLSYSRKLDHDYKPTEEIKNKSAYHRIDALRYVVVGVTKATPRRSTRSVVVARRNSQTPQLIREIGTLKDDPKQLPAPARRLMIASRSGGHQQ